MSNNLPPGCTDRDVDRAMGGNIGEESCEDCNGKGTVNECQYCGAEIEKAGICPKCGEETELAECGSCNGKGYIEYDIEQRRREARAEARLERYLDDRE